MGTMLMHPSPPIWAFATRREYGVVSMSGFPALLSILGMRAVYMAYSSGCLGSTKFFKATAPLTSRSKLPRGQDAAPNTNNAPPSPSLYPRLSNRRSQPNPPTIPGTRNRLIP